MEYLDAVLQTVTDAASAVATGVCEHRFVSDAVQFWELAPGAVDAGLEWASGLSSGGVSGAVSAVADGLQFDVASAAVGRETVVALLWVYVSLAVVGFVVCLAVHAPSVVYKLRLYGQGAAHLVASTDKKWAPYPSTTHLDRSSYKPYREIVFVRHGESTWNDTFNRSKNPIYFIPRLIKAWAYEAWLFASGAPDSWFYDSPLSEFGTGQAEDLAQYLATAVPERDFDTRQSKYITMLRGKGPASLHVVSNLRRAISTNAIALRGRIAATGESMIILPQLQEISRNIDTLSLTPPHSNPVPSWIDATNPNVDLADIFANHIDASHHIGNKPVRACGLDRLVGFCDWAFDQRVVNIVVGGHSLWFRAFFNEFLPNASSFVGKTAKLKNAAAVGFTLLRLVDTDGSVRYAIDEDSITEIHGGFDVKKAKHH